MRTFLKLLGNEHRGSRSRQVIGHTHPCLAVSNSSIKSHKTEGCTDEPTIDLAIRLFKAGQLPLPYCDYFLLNSRQEDCHINGRYGRHPN